jgi:hypothetical protein
MDATTHSPHFTAWLVPVLLFIGGIAWAVTWYLIQRFIRAVDKLHEAVHGPDGVVAKLRADLVQTRGQFGTFQLRTEADLQQAELKELLEAMRREALAREDRVLAALRDTAATMHVDIRAVREEVSKVHSRVDRVVDRRA